MFSYVLEDAEWLRQDGWDTVVVVPFFNELMSANKIVNGQG